jgi:undecaprenyl-diphosphatase
MEVGKRHYLETLLRLWPFILVMAVFWATSTYWWVDMGYEGTFRWLNRFRLAPLNFSSYYFFTNLGDGIILPALVLIFFCRKDPALAFTFVIAFILTGGTAQVAKRFVFEDMVRPTLYFRLDQSVDIFVNQVQSSPPRDHSFPSGHATSFATGGVFFAWGMYEWRKWLPFLVGLFTVFLCFTRVFLGVHFPGDVFVGSVIGTVGALLVLLIAYPLVHNRLHHLQRLSTPFYGRIVLLFSGLMILGQLLRIAIG